MNHVYRLVWSQVLNAWVAVAETGHDCGKPASSKLKRIAAATLLLCTGLAQAEPVGGQVATGTGSIAKSGATFDAVVYWPLKCDALAAKQFATFNKVKQLKLAHSHK